MLFLISVIHSILLLSNIPLWIYHNLFICLPVDGHLGCFLFGTIQSQAALNIHLQVFVRTCVFISPGVELLVHVISYV